MTTTQPKSAPPPLLPSSAFLYCALPAYFITFAFLHYHHLEAYQRSVGMVILLSSASFYISIVLIPIFMKKCAAKGLGGKDLNKVASKETIPEPLGIVVSVVYLLCVIFIQLLFSNDSKKLLEYNAGLLSLCLMSFLGFIDDIMDLPWRYKMTLPIFASVPILCAYSGSTSILLPEFLKSYYSSPNVDLGYIYHFYMGALTLFCTNSINIYAGINGLEVGQSLVMCCFVILYNLIEIHNAVTTAASESFLMDTSVVLSQNFFSLILSIPFFSVSLALLCFNWYPSKVFVGDSYTYFAGIYFAVVGILGHFSRTLILIFIPQIINFLLSLPQLLGVVPCPRHRVPNLDPKTGRLVASPNYTLINLVLKVTGPLEESKLVVYLLLLQSLCCCVSLFIRYSPLYRLFI